MTALTGGPSFLGAALAASTSDRRGAEEPADAAAHAPRGRSDDQPCAVPSRRLVSRSRPDPPVGT